MTVIIFKNTSFVDSLSLGNSWFLFGM